MDLHFLGIGGAYALELGGNCAYFKHGKTLFLIDCSEGVTYKLKQLGAFSDVENIIVAITHTHADHVAGLGVFLWYANFLLNIKPKIVKNSPSFSQHLQKLLQLSGVQDKFYEFTPSKSVVVADITVEMLPTQHTDLLECFGIMLQDKEGMYYYSGDTNDFENIKQLVNDSRVKRVYCEASSASYNVHIAYNQLKEIKSEKLVLMHFENVELYKLAQKDGFNVAKIITN